MLINLCGPPGAGKSTLAQEFANKHPFVHILSIDDYRRNLYDPKDPESSEMNSWYEMMKDSVRIRVQAPRDLMFVETSGLGWKLKYVVDHPTVTEKNLINLLLLGDGEVFKRRLKARNKPHVPFLYSNLGTHDDMVDRCLELLPKRYEKGIVLASDGNYAITWSAFEKLVLEKWRKSNE